MKEQLFLILEKTVLLPLFVRALPGLCRRGLPSTSDSRKAMRIGKPGVMPGIGRSGTCDVLYRQYDIGAAPNSDGWRIKKGGRLLQTNHHTAPIR